VKAITAGVHERSSASLEPGRRDLRADYIDPYRPDVRNPLLKALKKLPNAQPDCGRSCCGIGPLLPVLADQFATVHAVDFASGHASASPATLRGTYEVEFVPTSSPICEC